MNAYEDRQVNSKKGEDLSPEEQPGPRFGQDHRFWKDLVWACSLNRELTEVIRDRAREFAVY